MSTTDTGQTEHMCLFCYYSEKNTVTRLNNILTAGLSIQINILSSGSNQKDREMSLHEQKLLTET